MFCVDSVFEHGVRKHCTNLKFAICFADIHLRGLWDVYASPANVGSAQAEEYIACYGCMDQVDQFLNIGC